MRNKALWSCKMSSMYLIFLLHSMIYFTTGAVPAPGRGIDHINLPLKSINIVALTDVHSWVAGHGAHDDYMNASYGDVLSFYQHLQEICQDLRLDLFFVMNGDFMDGTALTTNPPSLLVPILEKMPWDVINIGNHELYEKSTIDYISEPGGFVDHWEGKYLTSNVRYEGTKKNVGEKARILRGQFGSVVLAFGFLFDMTDADGSIDVQSVEEVVKESWFVELLQQKEETYDAILVLAHMDVNDPLTNIILAAIRDVCGKDMVVQFITGHTHYRGFSSLDEKSVSFEAGRYLDTIGFVSFTSSGEFSHTFLDANVPLLASTLNIEPSNFLTADGKALSDLIYQTQYDAGFLNVLGCSPHNYYMNRSIDEPDSIHGLYLKNVVPEYLFQRNSSKILIQGRGDFRYSLYAGKVTYTDLKSVTPFHDTFNLVRERVQGSTLVSLVSTLNELSQPPVTSIYYNVNHIKNYVLPNFLLSGGDIDNSVEYDIYAVDFHFSHISDTLKKLLPEENSTITPNNAYPQLNVFDLWILYLKENWSCEDTSYPRTETSTDQRTMRISFAVILLVGGSAMFALVILKFARRKDDLSNLQFEEHPSNINAGTEHYDSIIHSPTGNSVV